ncbi:transcriptional regulator, AraC/XylS family [Shewanella violacea DSS12]|uniref:Transcriptional regulator, AraC/XylS family n=2 Tax=Shewanella violacea TaxID=60217 RepID=D4ZAW3_SHEVD|nr:transcriptional regulator, AraC/XylS family [Shewanella violacea DSS12]
MMAANPRSPALVKTIEMPKGYVDTRHHHDWHQVIFPIKGLLQTESEYYQHLVPHTSALFVPATLEHQSIALSNTSFIGIYINPKFCKTYSMQVRSISLTPFLKELLQEIRRKALVADNQDELLHLLEVLHDQILRDEVFTFQLLLPQDRRLKLIFDYLTERPALDWSLKMWGEKVGASERTLSRLFVKEFKTSFPLWRQHLRLIYSLSLLDENLTIQAIADKIGYQNDSSYIKAFKVYFDTTPQQFRANGNHQYHEL